MDGTVTVAMCFHIIEGESRHWKLGGRGTPEVTKSHLQWSLLMDAVAKGGRRTLAPGVDGRGREKTVWDKGTVQEHPIIPALGRCRQEEQRVRLG